MAELNRKMSVAVHHGNADPFLVVRQIVIMMGGGGAKDVFRCIQAENKSKMTVTFTKEDYVNTALRHKMVIDGKEITFHRADAKVTRLVVRGLPFEVEQETVGGLYSEYGRIISVERETFGTGELDGIYTGSWIIKMDMEKEIPNYGEWQGFTTVNLYRGMRSVCRKCGKDDHQAAGCSTIVCYNCRGTGHRCRECDQPCGRCGEKGHIRATCGIRSFADVVSGKTECADIPESEETSEEKKVQEAVMAAEEAKGSPSPKKEAAKPTTEIRADRATFIKEWLSGKFEEDMVVPVAVAAEKGLIVERERIQEYAKLYKTVAFTRHGAMVFSSPLKPGEMKDQAALTREKTVRVYEYKNTRSRSKN